MRSRPCVNDHWHSVLISWQVWKLTGTTTTHSKIIELSLGNMYVSRSNGNAKVNTQNSRINIFAEAESQIALRDCP